MKNLDWSNTQDLCIAEYYLWFLSPHFSCYSYVWLHKCTSRRRRFIKFNNLCKVIKSIFQIRAPLMSHWQSNIPNQDIEFSKLIFLSNKLKANDDKVRTYVHRGISYVYSSYIQILLKCIYISTIL